MPCVTPPPASRRGLGGARFLVVLIGWAGVSASHAAPPAIMNSPATMAAPESSLALATPDPSRQAFSATFSQSSTTGAISASFGTVPAGKRLVIENESLSCYVTQAATIQYAYVITNLGRTYLLLQKMGSAGFYDYYAGTYTSTMYADPTGLDTGDISVVVQASPAYAGTTTVHCDGAIIGHSVAHR